MMLFLAFALAVSEASGNQEFDCRFDHYLEDDYNNHSFMPYIKGPAIDEELSEVSRFRITVYEDGDLRIRPPILRKYWNDTRLELLTRPLRNGPESDESIRAYSAAIHVKACKGDCDSSMNIVIDKVKNTAVFVFTGYIEEFTNLYPGPVKPQTLRLGGSCTRASI